MSARRKPPAAALAVAGLIAAAVVLVVVNRATRPNRPTAAPERPAQPVVRARELEEAGRGPEAVAVLHTLLDANPDDVEALVVLIRVLPPDEKQELAVRLGACRDPDIAFENLYHAAEWTRDAAGTAVLLRWLKDHRPNDHRWACKEIDEKIAARKYAEAVELFRERAAVAADEPRAALLLAFVRPMAAAGRELDAYGAVPDAEAGAALRLVAPSLISRTLGGTDPAAAGCLRGLADAHRRRLPDDPQLWYFEGVLLQAGREYEKAEKVYAEGQAKGPLPRDDELFRTRRVECFYLAGKGLAAYDRVGPSRPVFRQLAWRFDFVKDTDSLAKLVAAHKAKFPADPDVPFWEADLLFLNGDYPGAAAALEAFRTASGRDLPERWRVYNLLVRSYLRVGNSDAARRAETDARAVAALPSSLRAAVLAATGEAGRLDMLLAAQSQASEGLSAIYADEDFAREIAAARYAELRKKYPDPRTKK